MSAITDLKDTLNNTVNAGVTGKSFLLPCYVNPDQETTSNHIALFYLDAGETYQLGKHSRKGFYSTPVQVAVRHSDYEQARTACFSALEFVSISADSKTGIYYDTRDSFPEYLGLDDTGAEVWAFNIFTKGRS